MTGRIAAPASGGSKGRKGGILGAGGRTGQQRWSHPRSTRQGRQFGRGPGDGPVDWTTATARSGGRRGRHGRCRPARPPPRRARRGSGPAAGRAPGDASGSAAPASPGSRPRPARRRKAAPPPAPAACRGHPQVQLRRAQDFQPFYSGSVIQTKRTAVILALVGRPVGLGAVAPDLSRRRSHPKRRTDPRLTRLGPSREAPAPPDAAASPGCAGWARCPRPPSGPDAPNSRSAAARSPASRPAAPVPA
jgi:hypothetical protein